MVIGACGQVGTELVETLASRIGQDAVIASDIRDSANFDVPYHRLDVMDKSAVESLIRTEQITEVYLLAALLSATAEKNPALGWKLNMDGLFNLLNIAKDGLIDKLFWPSSIAVFGPTTPKENTPQSTVIEPTTVYGISKYAGEMWCQYYHDQYGVDVRSIRYPGLIGWKSLPGGGTTDYAVDIFHQALKQGTYECFLAADTKLPMMYMADAVKATIDIMESPAEQIKIRTSYNIAAMSFDPQLVAAEISKHIPDFTITYAPDYRQKIAQNWPASIDDQAAREHWNWSHSFGLSELVVDMLENLKDHKLVDTNN